MNNIITKKLLYIIAFLFSAFMIINSYLGGVGVSYAASEEYSGALDDLQKDTAFNISDYPEDASDMALEVIQIAEGTKGELYLYVYQPAARFKIITATSINMSQFETIDGTKLYPLKLLTQTGVFQKYEVLDFAPYKADKRYYNISTIYRAYDEEIDEKSENNNEVKEIGINVGRLFVAETTEDGIKYSEYEQETITIRDKYVGYMLYPDGYYLTHEKNTAAFYVAFSTDRKMDNLLEATLSYTTHDVSHIINRGFSESQTFNYGDESEPITLTLHHDEYGTNVNSTWLFGKKAEWKRIQSKSDFISSEKSITDATKKLLEDKQWILRFYESNYTTTYSSNDWSESIGTYYTGVANVVILRLKFETMGKTYDLGAVDNKQDADTNQSNDVSKVEGKHEDWFEALCNWLASITGLPAGLWKAIFIAIPILIFLPIIVGILSALFPTFGSVVAAVLKGLVTAIEWIIKALIKGIILVFKGLIWLITLPFRGIAALFRDKPEPAETPEAQPTPTQSTARKNTAKKHTKTRAGKRRVK